jgi:hypothetical protein
VAFRRVARRHEHRRLADAGRTLDQNRSAAPASSRIERLRDGLKLCGALVHGSGENRNPYAPVSGMGVSS